MGYHIVIALGMQRFAANCDVIITSINHFRKWKNIYYNISNSGGSRISQREGSPIRIIWPKCAKMHENEEN